MHIISHVCIETCVFSFGGGPAVNRLSACKPCVKEAERLQRRQQMEKLAFLEVCFLLFLHLEFVTLFLYLAVDSALLA